MSSHTTQQLAQLLRGKRAVLEQLHHVGRRQGELVASGDVGSLLKLLAAKQRLLAGLQAVEKQLDPYREQNPDARVWQSPDHRAASAADAEVCRELLAEVMAMERTHEQQMTARRDKAAEQLHQVHTAYNARGAYETHRARPAPLANDLQAAGGAPAPAPTSIDLTSEA